MTNIANEFAKFLTMFVAWRTSGVGQQARWTPAITEDQMEISLTDKVVVVTGAANGIGQVIARTFAAEGAHVAALDLAVESLGPTMHQMAPHGGPHLAVAADVRSLDAVEEAVAEVIATFGRIDVLVNSAGVPTAGPGKSGRIDLCDPVDWERSLDVNLTGTFHMCRAVMPHMKAQRSGRILNAASFAAIVPSVATAAYAASKSGVVQFTRVLAGELGPWNVTANAYAPGMIPTALNGFEDLSAAEQDTLLDTVTLRRWGTKEEVAGLLCFLASDHAEYITGAVIEISGGKFATQMPHRAYAWADEDLTTETV